MFFLCVLSVSGIEDNASALVGWPNAFADFSVVVYKDAIGCFLH